LYIPKPSLIACPISRVLATSYNVPHTLLSAACRGSNTRICMRLRAQDRLAASRPSTWAANYSHSRKSASGASGAVLPSSSVPQILAMSDNLNSWTDASSRQPPAISEVGEGIWVYLSLLLFPWMSCGCNKAGLTMQTCVLPHPRHQDAHCALVRRRCEGPARQA
jgi:hypothetical protein